MSGTFQFNRHLLKLLHARPRAGHGDTGADVDLVPEELTFNRANELWTQVQFKELACERDRGGLLRRGGNP